MLGKQVTLHRSSDSGGTYGTAIGAIQTMEPPELTADNNETTEYGSNHDYKTFVQGLKDGGEMVGSRVRVKVVKNKVAPPFKQTEFDIMYGQGISYEGDVLDLAVSGDIVEKTGAWYSFEDTKIGQGRENSKTYLKENIEVLDLITKKVMSFMGLEQEIEESGK